VCAFPCVRQDIGVQINAKGVCNQVLTESESNSSVLTPVPLESASFVTPNFITPLSIKAFCWVIYLLEFYNLLLTVCVCVCVCVCVSQRPVGSGTVSQ